LRVKKIILAAFLESSPRGEIRKANRGEYLKGVIFSSGLE